MVAVFASCGGCFSTQPCYNPARLEKGGAYCQGEKCFPRWFSNSRGSLIEKVYRLQKPAMNSENVQAYLKIGDVARKVGVSPSVIRSWESLGLTRPRRTESKYRLYTSDDVKLLKRARFLRQVRGLNAPAIVQMLKQAGLVRPPSNGAASAIGIRLRQLRKNRGLSLAQVAKAAAISVG